MRSNFSLPFFTFLDCPFPLLLSLLFQHGIYSSSMAEGGHVCSLSRWKGLADRWQSQWANTSACKAVPLRVIVDCLLACVCVCVKGVDNTFSFTTVIFLLCVPTPYGDRCFLCSFVLVSLTCRVHTELSTPLFSPWWSGEGGFCPISC